MTAKKSEEQKGPVSEGPRLDLVRYYQWRSLAQTNLEAIWGVVVGKVFAIHVNLTDERCAN
jgi:hypothetical protein